MLSFEANVIMVSSGANVIIWCYHVMLSSGMITSPFFVFRGNFTHSNKQQIFRAAAHVCFCITHFFAKICQDLMLSNFTLKWFHVTFLKGNDNICLFSQNFSSKLKGNLMYFFRENMKPFIFVSTLTPSPPPRYFSKYYDFCNIVRVQCICQTEAHIQDIWSKQLG